MSAGNLLEIIPADLLDTLFLQRLAVESKTLLALLGQNRCVLSSKLV